MIPAVLPKFVRAKAESMQTIVGTQRNENTPACAVARRDGLPARETAMEESRTGRLSTSAMAFFTAASKTMLSPPALLSILPPYAPAAARAASDTEMFHRSWDKSGI